MKKPFKNKSLTLITNKVLLEKNVLKINLTAVYVNYKYYCLLHFRYCLPELRMLCRTQMIKIASSNYFKVKTKSY